MKHVWQLHCDDEMSMFSALYNFITYYMSYTESTFTRLNCYIKFAKDWKQSSNYVHRCALIHFLNNENTTKTAL
jgi:hypothetical protein